LIAALGEKDCEALKKKKADHRPAPRGKKESGLFGKKQSTWPER